MEKICSDLSVYRRLPAHHLWLFFLSRPPNLPPRSRPGSTNSSRCGRMIPSLVAGVFDVPAGACTRSAAPSIKIRRRNRLRAQCAKQCRAIDQHEASGAYRRGLKYAHLKRCALRSSQSAIFGFGHRGTGGVQKRSVRASVARTEAFQKPTEISRRHPDQVSQNPSIPEPESHIIKDTPLCWLAPDKSGRFLL